VVGEGAGLLVARDVRRRKAASGRCVEGSWDSLLPAGHVPWLGLIKSVARLVAWSPTSS
jgi:hypothetical protein